VVSKQRARSSADKQERRDHILTMALGLWGERTFASFTMAEVAERCGLAKGTLYLYFKTKEELFLALLEAQLGQWFDWLDGGLRARPEAWPGAAAVALVCETLAAQPALVRLLPIAASILEHNIDAGAARAYKTMLLERASSSGALLEARLSFLRPGEGVALLLQIYALVVGLGQMADPAPVVAQVLAEPHMAPLRVEFNPVFATTLGALLRGLEQR
jgi:AcrR family transcriptional regulator